MGSGLKNKNELAKPFMVTNLSRFIMKYYIIALLILFNLGLNAQNGFEVLISTDQHEKVVHVIEDFNNDYILVGKREIFDLNITKGYAVKLNQTGEILLEKEFILPDTALFITSSILLPDSNYLFICEFGDSTLQSILGIKTDVTFNEISRRYYIMPIEYSGIQDTKVYQCNNHIYLFGQLWNSDTSTDMYIYKLTYEGDSIDSKIFQMNYGQQVWAILDKRNNNGFNLYCSGWFPDEQLKMKRSLSHLITIDSLLNITSIGEVAGGLYMQNTAKWYNEKEYLLTGKYNTRDYLLMGILKLDTAEKILASNYFGPGPDTINLPAPYHNVDFISKNDIFFAGTININYYQYPWQEDPSWIMLARLDSNLNVKWEKYYGGDAFYCVYDIKATSDGGCIMACIRYDHTIQDYEWDVYILKVDSDGLVTSVDDQNHILISEAILYPNPGNDELYIRTGLPDSRIEMYDINGHLILSKEIKNHFQSVNTSSLPSASYIYRICRNTDLIQSGIWIKE
ncbi:MAG TPA: T9SS type A sorting domain-containing protein [Bacteroidales bacterium]|nr:T9SS type A sorting domain-containing protein [Bacteroidales bacterium]